MKITKEITERRKASINHLSRIEGQIKTLKKLITEDKCCADIATLTTSIAKSFDSLRAKTLEGFIANELMEGKNLSEAKTKQLQNILNLYKK
jgi:DNA-binding FrmR family transcriptional regulator